MAAERPEAAESPGRARIIHDLGGQGPLAHLAPANGFPPQAYQPLARALADTLHIVALEPLPMRAGGPPPPGLSWHFLAEEMAHHLAEQGLSHLVGLGHSLGGVMSLLATVRHPSLFRALVLMDPVIFPPATLWKVRLMRLVGLSGRYHLVRAAERRRQLFASREEVLNRYRGRSLFALWEEEALAAYVEHGFRERADGQVELRYDPRWEAAIFRTVPTDIWRWVRRVSVPVLVLYGQRSNTFRPAACRRLQRLWPHARFVGIPRAGHMFPMEQPAAVAHAIRQFVGSLTPV